MSWLTKRAQTQATTLVGNGVITAPMACVVATGIQVVALEYATRALRSLTNWDDVQSGKALRALNEAIVHALEAADKDEE